MSSPPESSPRVLSRIRIRTPADLERIYPLIEDFTQNPEHATPVKEIVFRYGVQQERYLRKTARPEEWKAAEAERELPDASSPLWRAVRRAGLDAEGEAHWVKMLSWMSPPVLAARKQALSDRDIEYQVGPWVRHQNSLFAQYAAAILLMLCPSIESLVYEDNDSRVGKPVYDILRRNNRGQLPEPALQKLRDVRLLPTSHILLGDERFYIEMDVLNLLGLFHRLPSLERLAVDAVSPNNDAGFDEEFPAASTAIKKIHMRHVSLPNSLITALVRAPRALEEFTCTSGGRTTSGGGFWMVHPEMVGRALWCQRGTLKKLDLDWDQYSRVPYSREREEREEEDEEGEEDEEPEWEVIDSVKTADLETGRTYDWTIGSLHDFQQLTHLSIGIQWLFGKKQYKKKLPDAPYRLIDSLPSSLEYLLIRGYRRGDQAKYDEQIDEFMALKESSLPKLKTVEGVAELIPSGRDVDRPDDNTHLLWKPEEIEDEW